jgi:hypothetical protein
MPPASARRSFHGPLIPTPATARPISRRLSPSGHTLQVVPSSPTASAIGRAVLKAAREEAPSSNQRERVLAGVLSALQRLTGANQ